MLTSLLASTKHKAVSHPSVERRIPDRCPPGDEPCPVGVCVGDRAVLLAGRELAGEAVVARLLDDVAMTSNGRIVAVTSLDSGELAFVSRTAVLLRDGDRTTDGRSIRLLSADVPAVNERRHVAAAVHLDPGGFVIIDDKAVVIEILVELADRAALTSRVRRVSLSDTGKVAHRGSFRQQERSDSGIATQRGVVVAAGDMMPDGRVIGDVQIPALTGSGEIAFIAEVGGKQTVLVGQASTGCRNRLGDDTAVPEAYGAAYDVDHPSAGLAVAVRCGFGRAMLQVRTATSRVLIHPDAYLWQQGAWRKIELRGEDRAEIGWFRGSASANLKLNGDQLRHDRLVLAHICTPPGATIRPTDDFRCGCRDRDCAESFWNLQVFRRPTSDDLDPPLPELPAPPPTPDPPPRQPDPDPDPSPGCDGSDAELTEEEEERGKTVFNRCRACHTVEEERNRIGPHLIGIFGRPAGTVEGFGYSDAMRDSGVVWDDDSLAAFVADPRGFIPGTRMAFTGLDDAQEIQDLLAYLRCPR